ncbi:MAG: YqaJ viral recombinase family protein [Planctomycetota bacterium]
MRASDVTSTEVSALYGLNPYVTAFELWHRKRDNVVEEQEPNERVRWGQRLQDAIAAGLAEERGWTMRRLDVYMRDEQDRLGCSFDYEAIDAGLGTGGAEIKNVDRSVFWDEWLDGADGLEAPQHIELQVQTQMELRDAPWWAIAALVGGNDLRVTVRMRDREIGQHIRAKVRAFWQSIAANEPPKPDYTLDAEFLCRLHGRATGETIEADPALDALLARYVTIGDIAKERDAIKAQVFECTTASKILTTFGAFSCGTTAATEGRRAFRQLRFIPNKKTKNP